jgi:hypothetical protein
MKLIGLDHDFFTQLLGLLDLNDFLNLWICGDVYLQQRLRSAKLYFDLHYAPQRQYQFPSILKDLSALKRLSLAYGCKATPKFVHGINLSSLPETLESLELDLVNGLQTLVSTNTELNDSDPQPLELGLVSLSTWFPRLHTLKFSNHYNTSELVDFSHFFNQLSALALTTLHFSSFLIDPKYLGVLPGGLTDLSCNLDLRGPMQVAFPPKLVSLQITGEFEVELLHEFPESLTELKLDISKRRREAKVPILPSELVILHMNCWLDWTVEAVKGLPKTLTSWLIKTKSLDREAMTCLPPKLEYFLTPGVEFSLRGKDVHIAAYLPRQLKSLPRAIYNIPSSDWIHLPRTMTELPFLLQGPQVPHIADLPPKLKSLVMTPGTRGYIPPHLRRGNSPIVPSSSDIGALESANWPFTSLTELTIPESPSFHQRFNLKMLSILPKLTKLAVLCDTDLMELLHLTCQLKELEITRGNPNSVPFDTPALSSLNRLAMGDRSMSTLADQEALMRALPRSLKHLFICSSTYQSQAISSSSIALLPPLISLVVCVNRADQTVFESLPATLEELSLFCPDASQYTTEMLNSLPFSLTKVHLPHTTCIRSARELIPFIEQRKFLHDVHIRNQFSSFSDALERILCSREGSVSLYASIMTQAICPRPTAQRSIRKK